MKDLASWIEEYGSSHKNKTNQIIHKICVPLIYFSVVGILWSIPLPLSLRWQFVDSLLWPAAIPILMFYFLLGIKSFLLMLLYTGACIGLILAMKNYQLNIILELSLIIFVLAWIMQFIGHKIEGKKPSFFKDLLFLLIGPLWVFKRIIN